MENLNNWEEKAYQCWMESDYDRAAELYDGAISANAGVKQNYWYLGLMRLLQGREAEAERVWALKMAEGEPDEVQTWTVDLISVLQEEAVRQKAIFQGQASWKIRQKIVEIAQRLLGIAGKVENKMIAYHLTIKTLLESGGNWDKAYEIYEEYQNFLETLIQEEVDIEPDFTQQIIVTLGFPSYLSDEPQKMHGFRHRFARFYQARVRNQLSNGIALYTKRNLAAAGIKSSKVMRVGYLSSFFYRHSIGWLVRWLLKYHDCEKFDIYAYSLRTIEDDIKDWIAKYTNFVDFAKLNVSEIAEAIVGDKIDVLVDLDSISHHLNCAVLALKPAPIQVTWLGWDASGLPGVDYFVADPYVLPESAGSYYAEQIWRVPKVYIAVDGFEVGIPTIRRDRLGIPNDGVVYFSSQMGLKRNPENARLQLKIIKGVENSYFLVKSLGDEEAIRGFFEEIAEAEGVERDRLRFLPPDPSEEIHRANLGIADVLLDTYPYNGATTTLETLWMGIPMVTRVGSQFAARNSYTMMMNVGVTEGIAWTDEEYVEWGIRLGKDPTLRQQIAWKLRQSRQTSPLWNAKQFAREMEKAYEQMWEIYLGRVDSGNLTG